MKLQQFNGGISTRKASHLIGINEGVVCTNVDVENELLGPIKQPLAAGATLTDNDRYIRYEDAIVTLAKVPHTVVEYRDKIYYSVLGDFIQVKDDTTEGDLGFNPPTFVGSTTIVPTIATPLIANVTMTEIDESGSGIDPSWHYKGGTDYYFALVEESPLNFLTPTERSAPLYFTHSTTLAVCSLKIDYASPFQLYKKIAGQWRRLGIPGISINLFGNDWLLNGSLNTVKYDETGSAPNELATVWGFPFTAGTVTTRLHTGLYNTDYSPFWSTVTDVAALEAQTIAAGDYTYVAIQSSSTLGWQSPRSELLTATVLSGELLALTIDVNTVDPRADQLSVYRIGGNITEFTLVTRIDNPVYPLLFTDDKADTVIAGNHILTTLASARAKLYKGVTNLAISGGQLIGTYKTRLLFSELGQVYAFPSTNYRDFKETLTGCFPIDAGVLIFSATRTWLLNTSNLATGKVIQLSDEFGCVGHETIVGFKTGAMWSSQQGFCVSSGGRVELVSKDKIGYDNLNIVKAVMHNEIYHGMTVDGVDYTFDMRYGAAIVKHVFKLFDDMNVTTDVRQIYRDGIELKVLFGSIIAADSYTLFKSTSSETFTWESAKFIEGSLTELKHYKDVYLHATKDITITVLIDDKIVLTKTLYDTATHNLKIPQNKQQGYGISFKIEGTGTVSELEYKTMGRQNGR